MTRNSKPAWPKKESSPDPELLEKIDTDLNRLLVAGDSAPFDPDILQNLAATLDRDTLLTDFFLAKVLAEPNLLLTRLLIELDRHIHSKPVHKGIKRTLYRLKQRGIDLPPVMEDKDEKDRRGVLKEPDSGQVSGYLSEFDEMRNRMVALFVPQVSKGRLFVFGLIDPDGGLERLSALVVSKKESKILLQDVKEQAGHSFLPADPGQVAFILKEAHERRSSLSKEDEDLYAHIIMLLTGFKTVGRAPIIRTLFPEEESLMESPLIWEKVTGITEVAYYMPKAGVLEPYLKAVQEVQEGILILNQAQKQEQIEAIVVRAAREIFQGREREDLIRYLEELSYLYYLKGQKEEAKVLFSASSLLAKENEKGPARENSLLIRLVEKALSLESIIEEDGTQGPVMEKSPGGIIIPPWVKS